MTIDIDSLTVGQVKEIMARFGGSIAPANPTACSAKTGTIERPVLVTTTSRGVFFGYATDTSGDTILLKRARNCLYWSRAVKGFVGLASDGPDKDCRVGPAADMELRGITCVASISDKALKAWEAAPWTA